MHSVSDKISKTTLGKHGSAGSVDNEQFENNTHKSGGSHVDANDSRYDISGVETNKDISTSHEKKVDNNLNKRVDTNGEIHDANIESKSGTTMHVESDANTSDKLENKNSNQQANRTSEGLDGNNKHTSEALDGNNKHISKGLDGDNKHTSIGLDKTNKVGGDGSSIRNDLSNAGMNTETSIIGNRNQVDRLTKQQGNNTDHRVKDNSGQETQLNGRVHDKSSHASSENGPQINDKNTHGRQLDGRPNNGNTHASSVNGQPKTHSYNDQEGTGDHNTANENYLNDNWFTKSKSFVYLFTCTCIWILQHNEYQKIYNARS